MSYALRRVEATRPAGPLRRAFSRVALTRPLLFFSRHISWKLDPILLRITHGRVSSTLVLPVGVLETRGARTGERRQNAVIYWHDGESVIIAASQAGMPRNPAWYHNAVANREVSFATLRMHVTEVDDAADRDRLWARGDRVFPAFAEYRRRAAAAGRSIPLLRLTPTGAGTTGGP